MGNTLAGDLRAAFLKGDLEGVRRLLSRPEGQDLINRPLNRDGDTPLILACRLGRRDMAEVCLSHGCEINLQNRHGETALDVALHRVIPSDHVILLQHSRQEGSPPPCQLNDLLRLLLTRLARGQSLQRLILHYMRDAASMETITRALVGVDDPGLFRISGLLLQVAVWFGHNDNLLRLFRTGVSPENFWMAGFLPQHQLPSGGGCVPWPEEDCGEYALPVEPQQDAVLSLKLALVQDWREEWDNGNNSAAQFRAGLHLTPETAAIFIRAANDYDVIAFVMDDIMQYLPTLCRGPDLRRSAIIDLLMHAGYQFSEEEIRHLTLKFQMDFKRYHDFQSQPKCLKELSRIVVRNCFTRNVYYSLSHIEDLPRPLVGYLLLEDCRPPPRLPDTWPQGSQGHWKPGYVMMTTLSSLLDRLLSLWQPPVPPVGNWYHDDSRFQWHCKTSQQRSDGIISALHTLCVIH